VRGYRENELVRDNAVIASLESQIPLVRDTPWADVLQLAPFVDVGNAWNTKVSTPDPRTLVSVGIGLRWALTVTRPFRWQPSLEIYWGYPFEDTGAEGDDLQDLGLHFQVAVTGL
jgi:hemolysin activation/secretion protein